MACIECWGRWTWRWRALTRTPWAWPGGARRRSLAARAPPATRTLGWSSRSSRPSARARRPQPTRASRRPLERLSPGILSPASRVSPGIPDPVQPFLAAIACQASTANSGELGIVVRSAQQSGITRQVRRGSRSLAAAAAAPVRPSCCSATSGGVAVAQALAAALKALAQASMAAACCTKKASTGPSCALTCARTHAQCA